MYRSKTSEPELREATKLPKAGAWHHLVLAHLARDHERALPFAVLVVELRGELEEELHSLRDRNSEAEVPCV